MLAFLCFTSAWGHCTRTHTFCFHTQTAWTISYTSAYTHRSISTGGHPPLASSSCCMRKSFPLLASTSHCKLTSGSPPLVCTEGSLHRTAYGPPMTCCSLACLQSAAAASTSDSQEKQGAVWTSQTSSDGDNSKLIIKIRMISDF